MTRLCYLTLGAAFVLGVSAPARAGVEADAVLNAVAARFETAGMQLTAASAEKSGNDVILKGVEFINPKSKVGPTLFSEVKLENVSEKDGGYLIGQVAAAAGEHKVEGGTWSFGGLTIKNITLSANGKDANPIEFESFQLMPTTFATDGGKDFIKLGQISMTMPPAGESKVSNFEVKPAEFTIDTTAVPPQDKDKSEQLAALGFTVLKGRLSAKGSWNKADGRIQITENAIALDNAGKLNFTMDIGGYTPGLMQSMQTLLEDKDPDNKAANGIAMLGLMQNLTLNSIALRFDDASITDKILDMAAKRSGQTKEILIAQTKAMAPLMAVPLKNAEFVTNLAKAVSDYLDKPKNFEIKLAPEKPMPIALLIAVGATDPQALIEQVNLKVLANQ